MSLDVRVDADGVRAALSRDRIAEVARMVLRAEGERHALVSITLLSKRAMAGMNRRHLDHAGATDVISFGFTRATPRDPVVGDIYISPEVASSNAREHHITAREELTRLVVHGVLHILGHEHPEAGREESAMWDRQERLVRRSLGAMRKDS